MSEHTFWFAVNFIIVLLEAWIGYLVVEYEVTGGFWFMAFLLLFMGSPDSKEDNETVKDNKLNENNKND